VLPAAMILLIVITALGFGYLTLGLHETKLTYRESDSAQAFFLAQAGVQRTYYTLSITDDWSTLPSQLYSDEALDDGTYSVALSSKTPNSVEIEAVGVVRKNERIVHVSVERAGN